MPATHRHTSPDTTRPERQARAPYNFVPLPQAVFTAAGGLPVTGAEPGDDGTLRPWHLHGGYITGALSGWVDIEAAALSPVFVRGATKRLRAPLPRMPETWDARDVSRRPEPFMVGNGLPAIPASSLRGMVRSMVEMITAAKIGPVTDDAPIFRSVTNDRVGTAYRNRVANGGKGPGAGFLRRAKNGDWSIEPTECLRVPHYILGRFPDFRYFLRTGYRPAWTLQQQTCWVLTDADRKWLVTDLTFERDAPGPEWKRVMLVLSGSAQRKKAEFAFVLPTRPESDDRGRKPRRGRGRNERGDSGEHVTVESAARVERVEVENPARTETAPTVGSTSTEAVTSNEGNTDHGIPASDSNIPSDAPADAPAPSGAPVIAASIPVPDEVIARFHSEDQLTQWQERAFPYWEPEFNTRDQQDRAINRRRSDPGNARRRRIRPRHGHLRDGEPVFFTTTETRSGRDVEAQPRVAFLGRARSFRLPADRSPRDLVPDHLRDAPIDLAEAMFGGVKPASFGRPQRAIASRIRIEDAVADPESQPNGGWTYPVMVPQTLAPARAGAFNLMLSQGSDDPYQLTAYLKGDKTSIRGHKLYWHRWAGNIGDIAHPLSDALLDMLMPKRRDARPERGNRRSDRASEAPAPDAPNASAPQSDGDESAIEGQSSNNAAIVSARDSAAEAVDNIDHAEAHAAHRRNDERQQAAQRVLAEGRVTLIKPVREGVVFRGRIRFDNLTELELGALLSALSLPRGCAHRIGLGRPLGLGSVRITPKLRLIDREARYKSWEHPEYVSQAECDKAQAAALESFTKAMLLHAKGTDEALFDDGDTQHAGLRRIGRIDSLYTILNWDQRPTREDTRYMEVERRGPSPYATGQERGPVNEFRLRPVLPTAQNVAGRPEPEWTGPTPAPAPTERDLGAASRPRRPRMDRDGEPRQPRDRGDRQDRGPRRELDPRGSRPMGDRPAFVNAGPSSDRGPRRDGPSRDGPGRRDGPRDSNRGPGGFGGRDGGRDGGRGPGGDRGGFGRPRMDPDDRLIPGLNVSLSTGRAKNVQYKDFKNGDIVQGEVMAEKTAKGAPKVRLHGRGKQWEVPVQTPAGASKPPEDLAEHEQIKVKVVAVNARSGEPAVVWDSRLIDPAATNTPPGDAASESGEAAAADA